MSKEYFVAKGSIVREIWGKGDTILLIFAGAAAEFALNKAVDWLYFTGRLPADPLGRLFSTVSYARSIVFAEHKAALCAIDAMSAIHAGVEAKRGAGIPDWAYRDVLFMLIDYSICAFEVLERKMLLDEKKEVFRVFRQLGSQMGVKELPETFEAWQKARHTHLQDNLLSSTYTADLFGQYKKHLGLLRYRLLLEAQMLVVPPHVGELLGFKRSSLLNPLILLYKLCKSLKADSILKDCIMPSGYKSEISKLDVVPADA